MKRVIVFVLAGLAVLLLLSLVLGLAHPFGNPRATTWLMESDITEAQEQMNLSQWESLPDEEIRTLRAEIAGVARAHIMPPLQYRVAHGDVAVTEDDVKVLRDWARGNLTQERAAAEKTLPDAGPGDVGRGRRLFASNCVGCHSLKYHQEGPKLAGVFGRTSGTAPGFLYSAALKKAAVKWDEQSLDKWLSKTDAVTPMNNMYFHVVKAEDLRDLIAYLQASSN